MGARDPSGGSILTAGDYDLSLGGPLGTLMAFGLFVVVAGTLVAVITALEAVIGRFLPRWLVLPSVLVVATAPVVAALWGVLRVNEWRRYR